MLITIYLFLLQPTVQTFLRDTYPYLVNPSLKHEFFFVHRLDYATSGVICVALTKEACREAASAFQNRDTKKYYIALLRGHVSKERLLITRPIGKRISLIPFSIFAPYI